MQSLRRGYTAVVFGASGGIGAALTAQLAADAGCGRVFAGARSAGSVDASDKVTPFAFDLADEQSIEAACRMIGEAGAVDLAIVATGFLHGGGFSPEKTWRALDAAAMQQVFLVNAIGPSIVAKHVLGLLNADSKSVLAALSARVGSISDNRLGGWHSYRASKAALNQIIRTISIELARRNPMAACVGLHPGTVDTGLSSPFQGNVPASQLMAPDESAAHLLRVLDEITPEDSGACLAWDGTVVPA